MSARTAVALAWVVPAGALAVVLVWLLPAATGSGALGTLSYFQAGTIVFQLFWLVWSSAIAVVASTMARGGRRPGLIWAVLQGVLLVLALVRTLPPLLAGTAPAVGSSLTTGFAWVVLPALALLLSAVQGILLFLAA